MNETWIQAASIGDEWSMRWAIALLHFLWQGAVVGCIAWIGDFALRNRSAANRYTLHAAALVCLPLCVMTTAVFVAPPKTTSPQRPSEAAPTIASESEPYRDDGDAATIAGMVSVENVRVEGPVATELQRVGFYDPAGGVAAAATVRPTWLHAITWGYMLGLTILLMRLVVAVWGGHRLRTSAVLIDDPKLLELIERQAKRFGLRAAPAISYCRRIAAPTVIGVLRPMILLPTSIVSGLDQEQLAAILGHELAHIRRYDLLMNLLQRVLETVLFFHPVVWFVSRRLSEEREQCCDDLVVALGAEPIQYAGALLRIAELQCHRPPQATALAASGQRPSQLEVRIERLLSQPRRPALRLTVSGTLTAILVVGCFAAAPLMLGRWTMAAPLAPAPSPATLIASDDPDEASDTTKKKTTPKASQDKTAQDKTSQDKTSQDKTAGSENKPQRTNYEPFPCEFVDAATGKLITQKHFTIQVRYREPKSKDGKRGTVIDNVIWGPKSPGEWALWIPDRTLNHPQRARMIGEWAVAHPRYESRRGEFLVEEVIRDEPKSARESLRKIRLKPRPMSVADALKKKITFEAKDMPFTAVLSKLSMEHGVPVTLDYHALRKQGIRPPSRISVKAKDATLRSVFNKVFEHVGATHDVSDAGVVSPSTRSQQQRMLDELNRLNQESLERVGEGELQKRIEAYERAYKLQAALGTDVPTSRHAIEQVYRRAFDRNPTEKELISTMHSIIRALQRSESMLKKAKESAKLRQWIGDEAAVRAEYEKFVRGQIDVVVKEPQPQTPLDRWELGVALRFGGDLSPTGVTRAFERVLKRKPTLKELVLNSEWILEKIVDDDEFRRSANKGFFSGVDMLDKKWDESFDKVVEELKKMFESGKSKGGAQKSKSEGAETPSDNGLPGKPRPDRAWTIQRYYEWANSQLPLSRPKEK